MHTKSCTYIEPEVVGTTGMSSGAAPSTHGICNWGATALITIVLSTKNNTVLSMLMMRLQRGDLCNYVRTGIAQVIRQE